MQPGDFVFFASITSNDVRADVVTEVDSLTKFRGLKNGWQYTRDWHPTLSEALQSRAVRLEQEQVGLRRYIRNLPQPPQADQRAHRCRPARRTRRVRARSEKTTCGGLQEALQ